MKEEITQLVEQFLTNEKQAHEYYMTQRIGFEHLVKMKQQNAENISKVIRSITEFCEANKINEISEVTEVNAESNHI